VDSVTRRFVGDRSEVRRASVTFALEGLLERARGHGRGGRLPP